MKIDMLIEFKMWLYWPLRNRWYWFWRWPPVWEEVRSLNRLHRMGWSGGFGDGSVRYFKDTGDANHMAVVVGDFGHADIWKRDKDLIMCPITGMSILISNLPINKEEDEEEVKERENNWPLMVMENIKAMRIIRLLHLVRFKLTLNLTKVVLYRRLSKNYQ